MTAAMVILSWRSLIGGTSTGFLGNAHCQRQITLGVDLCHVSRLMTQRHLGTFDAILLPDLGGPCMPELVGMPMWYFNAGLTGLFYAVSDGPAIRIHIIPVAQGTFGGDLLFCLLPTLPGPQFGRVDGCFAIRIALLDALLTAPSGRFPWRKHVRSGSPDYS